MMNTRHSSLIPSGGRKKQGFPPPGAFLRLLVVCVFVCAAFPSSLQGMFVVADPAPVERLLKNARDYLDKHPDDANAYYILARIHYLAFANNNKSIRAALEVEGNGKETFYGERVDFDTTAARERRAAEIAARECGSESPEGMDFTDPRRARYQEIKKAQFIKLASKKWTLNPFSAEQMIGHATQAVKYFNEAIHREPKNGLYVLGLASLMEEFADWSAEIGVSDPKYKVPGELQGFSRQVIRQQYYKAFSLTIGEDSKNTELSPGGLGDFVSYEAGQGFINLADRGIADRALEHPYESKDVLINGELTKEEREQMGRIKAALAKLKKLPQGAVTPIIFSRNSATSIQELLLPAATVDFNLRGYGTKERWLWVKPTTGFLVWDPEHKGRITSGCQMFGSYTFQIFWRNGYEALRALDDNHDGVLSGAELDGLSVWFNAASDGCCKPGEVMPVQSLGITGISVEAPACEGPHPMNPLGITFGDGHSVPTWDWTTESVANAGQR